MYPSHQQQIYSIGDTCNFQYSPCRAPGPVTPSNKRIYRASSTMEMKKHVRDNVLERYRSGLGSKEIYKTLNIPLSTGKYITRNGKNMKPQQPCQKRAGHQNSLTRQKGH